MPSQVQSAANHGPEILRGSVAIAAYCTARGASISYATVTRWARAGLLPATLVRGKWTVLAAGIVPYIQGVIASGIGAGPPRPIRARTMARRAANLAQSLLAAAAADLRSKRSLTDAPRHNVTFCGTPGEGGGVCGRLPALAPAAGEKKIGKAPLGGSDGE